MKLPGMLMFGIILVIVSLLILGVADSVITTGPLSDPTLQTAIGIFLGALGLIIVYLSRKKA